PRHVELFVVVERFLARGALAFAALLPPAAAVLAGGVAPVVAAADLLLRAQGFQREVDGGGQLRLARRRAAVGLERRLVQAVDLAGAIDQILRPGRVGELQRSAAVEPADGATGVGVAEV